MTNTWDLELREKSDVQLTVIYFALMLTMWLFRISGHRGKQGRLWAMIDSVNSIEAVLKRKVGYSRRGRPVKADKGP